MNVKENKLPFVLLLFIGLLFGNVISQFIFRGSLSPASFLGTLAGFALAVSIHWFILKKPGIRPAGILLIAILTPLPLAGLVSLLLSFLQIRIGIEVFLSIYLLGFLIILFFGLRPGSMLFPREIPGFDERHMSHFYQAGAWSFLFLFFLVMAALVQPWIGLSRPGLWFGVLTAGFLFWLANIVMLELRK